MRSLIPVRVSSRIVFLTLAAGCSTATSSPVAQPPELRTGKSGQTDSSIVVSRGATVYTPGRLQYDLQNSSVVRAIASDSAHRADSTRLIGTVTATLVPGPTHNTVVARVQFDSGSIASGSGTSVPIPPTESLVFTVDTETGRIASMKQEVHQDCATHGADGFPFYGREVLPTIHAPVALAWIDTVETSTCRGGAFLSITRIASYTRLQASDSVLRLLRLTQFRIIGDGHQWNQKIRVSGEGKATDTLRLSGFPLRVQEVAGSSEIELSFRTELRVQEFIQTSTTHIVLRTQ